MAVGEGLGWGADWYVTVAVFAGNNQIKFNYF